MLKRDKGKGQKLPTQEWIEMEDLQAPQNQAISKKFAQMEGREYVEPISQTDSVQYPDLSSPTLNKNKQISSSNSQSPLKHTSSHQKQNKPASHPSLPMMEVTCDFCTVIQRVPGNTQVYSCGSCQNMNQCYPLYAVTVCGCCQAQVGFGFGMSQYIRCPKCSSVNKVPLEPVKKYQSISVLGAQNIPEVVGTRQIHQRQVQRDGRGRFAGDEYYEYVDFERKGREKD